MLQQTGTITKLIIRTKNFKIQYGGLTPYWKIKFFGYNSTTVYLICRKFCTKMQNPSTVTIGRQKSQICRIQDGGRICSKILQTHNATIYS